MGELEEQVRLAVPEAVLRSDEPAMRQALELAFKVAATEATLLLRGESGTGKESWRGPSTPAARVRPAPSLPSTAPACQPSCWRASCSATPKAPSPALIKDTVGKVTVAEGGRFSWTRSATCRWRFSPSCSACCKRSAYERVGETQTRVCNVRILAATNHDLEAQIAAGKFREDLFYRLNVVEVTLPPLRQRPHDIAFLAEHLLRFFARQSGKSVTGFSDEVKDALARYPWAGNVRELRNAIERGVILASGPVVGLGDLPVQIGQPSRAGVNLGGSGIH